MANPSINLMKQLNGKLGVSVNAKRVAPCINIEIAKIFCLFPLKERIAAEMRHPVVIPT